MKKWKVILGILLTVLVIFLIFVIWIGTIFTRGLNDFFAKIDFHSLLEIDNPGWSSKKKSSSKSETEGEEPTTEKYTSKISIPEEIGINGRTRLEIGDYITFGSYEQDNDLENGTEEIEWMILEFEKDKMLVISRYGLDCQPYNTEYDTVTWETCSLREWLNSTFYETAFTSDEQRLVLNSSVTVDPNSSYDTPSGHDTMDKVFLLSVKEASWIFPHYSAGSCQGTPYCYAQGAGTDCWWLRSPGCDPAHAAYVFPSGISYRYGNVVNYGGYAVRPAMWINLTP